MSKSRNPATVHKANPRNALGKALLATVFTLAMTAQAAAGTPTYHVIFDGGGVLENSITALNNAMPPPAGVCGMRVNGADLLSFHWAEYNPYNLGDPMAEAPFGPPSSATYDFPAVALETVIEFTGPLSEECEDEWVFHLPLTGDWPTHLNGTPDGAGALVFQITQLYDVDWLDAGFQIWDAPGEEPGQSEDPEIIPFCEQWPDACSEEPEITYEIPCDYNLWSSCEEINRGTRKTLAAEYLAGIAIGELQVGLLLPAITQVPEPRRRLESAHEAVQSALMQIDTVRDLDLNPFKDKAANSFYASAVKAHLGLAEVALRSCQHNIELEQMLMEARQKDSRKPGYFSAKLAVERCAAAIEALITTRDRLFKISENTSPLP